LIVARCQSDSDVEATEAVEEVGNLGIIGEDVQDLGDGIFSPAPGVETICVFLKNGAIEVIVLSILCIKVSSCVFMELRPVFIFLLIIVYWFKILLLR
jgi:hypothetical protein